MLRVVCLLVCACLLVGDGVVEAATRTVCASGCQYTAVQAAIDAAGPGDTILLRAGETFISNLVLRAKDASATAYITIRSDASDTSLPAPGVRLVPEGKTGANVTRSLLARLIGVTGGYKTTPVIRTEPGAHHYRLQFLDIDGVSSEGYYSLITLGENVSTQTFDNAPHHIVFDRVYAHGHPTRGMRRGIALNGASIDVINSYLSDFFSAEEAQALSGYNGAGPFRIQNDFIEAAGENIMFGGADPRTTNLVPSDIVIRGNHFSKKLAWRDPALAPPASPGGSATTGGVLPAGTHYFKVVALLPAGGNTLVSAPSAQFTVTVGANGAARVTWYPVSNAAGYRVYRGTSSNGENRYLDTAGTSFTYTGSGERSGTPPAYGTKWSVKNMLELKNAQRVTVDGNLFEYNWKADQTGYAIVLTPRNQEGTAPWSVVRDVTFTNNIVRHVAAAMIILGRDYEATSQHAENFSIVNNVFDDVSTAYGGAAQFLVITDGPSNVTVDHNTVVNAGSIVQADNGTTTGFVYTNNFSRNNTYGVFGSNCAPGSDSLDAYFPGAVFTANVLAGGDSSIYPAGNYFPSVSTFNSSFVDPSAGDYTLVSSSPFRSAGTDGKDIGIDMVALATAHSVRSDSALASLADGGGDAVTPSLPSGWTGEDVGLVGVAGASSSSNGTFTVDGAGADVWGTADAFRFAYVGLDGDGTIVARVASLSGTEAWTKVGVMIRGSLDPSSSQAFMLVSKGKGLAFQRRTSTGALSTHTGAAGAAPAWVKLTRAGNVISAYASADGKAWTSFGSDTFIMPAQALVGLAVSSHSTTATARGVFDSVSIVSGAAGLPVGWDAQDVGVVGLTGGSTQSAGTFTVKGAGPDIWGTADAFQFAYRPLAADGTIVARVAGLAGAEAWTKVGVMMRQTLDAGSAQAMMLVSLSKGLAFQRRTVTGGTSTNTSGGAGTAPVWLKLTRSGPTVTASVSSDGSTWRVVGSDTLSFTGGIYVGLAVSSHTSAAVATGIFDGVSVTP